MTTPPDEATPSELRVHPELERSPAWVDRRRREAEPFVLIDCRTDGEREIAAIEGAIPAPLQDLHSHLEHLREHEETEIVVFCHHGVRSMHATMALREAGFEDVRSMHGGIDLWSRTVDDTVPTY